MQKGRGLDRVSDYRVDTLRLAWLQAFIAVVETNSFSMAAKRLKWSQSTVSRYVKDLSVWLDKPLFASPSVSSLTPQGAEFLETARQIVAMLQDARSDKAAAKSTASTRRKGKFARAVITGSMIFALGHVYKALMKGRAVGFEIDTGKRKPVTVREREVRKGKKGS